MGAAGFTCFHTGMHNSFGARLRHQRERRGLSVKEIADQTKIKASLLDGLERDDISQWPAGIFRRAYVRTYANAIGYDADTAVREFLDCHPEPVEPIDLPPPAPNRLRNFVESALGSFRKPSSVSATTGDAEAVRRTPDTGSRTPSSVPRISNLVPRTSNPGPRTSDPGPRTSDPGPRTSDPGRPISDLDLLGVARICTELGRVDQSRQVLPLLREAAKILGGQGLIVWGWDGVAEELKPAFVHGYAAKVRSRLRGVSADADNVTAAAFRTKTVLAVGGDEGANGALAVPLLTPSGCAGVLAIELPDGREQAAAVRAIASIFAAMLAQLVGVSTGESRDGAPGVGPSLETQPG